MGRYLANVASGNGTADNGEAAAPSQKRKRGGPRASGGKRPAGPAAGSSEDGSQQSTSTGRVRVRRSKSSRYKGVSTKSAGCYQARVQPAPRAPQVDLGQYRLECAAALAYDRGCAELGRAGAAVNFGSKDEYERARAEEAGRVWGSDVAEPEGVTYDAIVARVRAKVARKMGGKKGAEGGGSDGTASGSTVPAAGGADPGQPQAEAEAPSFDPPVGESAQDPSSLGDLGPAGQDVDLELDGAGDENGVTGDPPFDLAYLDSSHFGVGEFGGQQEPDGGETPVTIVEI